MTTYRFVRLAVACLMLAAALSTTAAGAAPAPTAAATATPAVVSHIQVLSDKVPDVSSLEAWKKSFIKDGMSDKDKALAVWKTVATFQHQDSPPVEDLHWEGTVLDAIKMFNVYGYSFCSVATSEVLSLGRYVGLQGRGWTIQAHCVPELSFDGAYHMLDSSLINYFPKPDGQIAGVEEISAAVKAWLAEHPDLKASNAKLTAFQKENGWTGWKRGPALLAACPFYDAGGWWPAHTHGWAGTMLEYDGRTLRVYESGYSTGYQVNVQLRPGERLIRNWSNKGLHVNMDGGEAPGCLKMTTGKENLVYTPKYGDLAPGRVGNGTLEYDVPLASGAFRGGALVAENLAAKAEDKAGPAVHVKDAAKDGVLVIRMPSSYVYLSGTLTLTAAVGAGGEIAVQGSDNNGLDWRDLAKITAAGEAKVDLKPLVFRRYDYRLRFTLKGAGTGLDALKITHDIQHSQRALPALAEGANTITFRAGPQEGTITLEGSTEAKNKGKQLTLADFHPETKGLKSDIACLAGGSGEIVFPVETPGDMTRLRVGCFYRCREAKDQWDVQVSFDGGQVWKSLGLCDGPQAFAGKSFATADVPAATRKALVRLAGTQRNTAMLFNLRIDADYREPAGGFRPVRITYVWDEAGAEKRDVHVANKPEETYTITCAGKPGLKSLIVELAD